MYLFPSAYRKLTYIICLILSVHIQVNGQQNSSIQVLNRFVSIDNVCAWPNITRLQDGSLIATIFNQPAHGRLQGDVECWGSTDGGMFWTKRGTAAPHQPLTNRMNVAAGTANNGDMIVIASGWSLKPSATQKGYFDLIDIIPPWVSRSSDGARNWSVNKSNAFPGPRKGYSGNIPFGDIIKANDGSLRVIAYNQSDDKVINSTSMYRSDDDGKTWKWFSTISAGRLNEDDLGHNETAVFHTGNGNWIAAARRWKRDEAMDLFVSNDDGKSWKFRSSLTGGGQHPGHLLRLNNGDLLLTFGNRIKGSYGVAVKLSKDNGLTWSEDHLIISDLKSSDSGYPASAQLEDGSIMTAYYANGSANHSRYHMGTVIWKFK